MSSIIPPSKADPTHFSVGDEVQFGYDDDAAAAVVIVAEPDSDGCIELS